MAKPPKGGSKACCKAKSAAKLNTFEHVQRSRRVFEPKDCRVVRSEQTLGRPDILFMRGILFLKMQMQGKKPRKVGHLARLFNAADAFSGRN
ncbi:MAG TPA: hypothetical protein PL031_05755, partial [Neisseria sp.]|nr:hypothetical protein [Neisseria sp.]